jgi:hypothetical protein
MRTADNIPYLSQANFLGEGFDIYGAHDVMSSAITPLLDPAKAGTKPFTCLGHEYVVPSYVIPSENTNAQYREFTGSTRDSFQNNLSEHAQVHVSYGAFSGQMEQSYSSQFTSNSEYFFSYRNFFSRLALLQLAQNVDQYLSEIFKERVKKLPAVFEPKDLDVFADFFDDFGPYFTSEIALGGALEYYVAVSKTSQTSMVEISANVKVDYNAVYVTGGVSAEVKNTKSWQRYSANRSVNIMAKGGDPALLAKLTSVDPDQPNSQGVSYYNQWLDSLDTDPAITNFKLRGIWELCGDKREAVESAFHEYGRSMRPRLVIETSSVTGVVPIITLGGEIRPSSPPKHPQGYQLVVLDRNNPSVSGVRLNRYYSYAETDFYQSATVMYNQMLADIKDGKFDNNSNVLVLASFGLSKDAPPPSKFYGFLRSAGGGSQLLTWVETANPGSSYDWWAVYAFAGIPNLGPSSGIEVFDTQAGAEVTKLLEVLFYRQRGGSLYSLGAGEYSSVAAAASN